MRRFLHIIAAVLPLLAFSCIREGIDPDVKDPHEPSVPEIIDGPETPQEGQTLQIRLAFRKEELLTDNTQSGSAWPFDQPRGASSNLQTASVFTVTEGGFPIGYSGVSYYLNSKTGVRLNLHTGLDYLEFPAIYGARLSRVKYIAGISGSRPSITDDSGTVLMGGDAPASGLAVCSPYTWTLTGNAKGAATRLVFGTSSASVMYIGLEYQCERDVVPSDLGGVTVWDARNDIYDSHRVQLCGAVDASGEVVCGFEYRKAFSHEAFTSVECPAGDFSWEMPLEDGVRYEYRGWACRNNSWKHYSAPVSIQVGSLLLPFFPAAGSPFAEELPQEALSSTSDPLRWTLRGDTPLPVETFVPAGVRFGRDAGGRLVMGSSGSKMPSWIRLPEIEGKTLSMVILQCKEVPENGTAVLCRAPVLSEAVSFATPLSRGVATEIGVAPIGGMAGGSYLLLPTAGNYVIERVSVCYEGDASSTLFVEEPDDSAPDYQGGTLDYSALAAMGHPRLFMTEEGFADLFAKLSSTDPSYQALRAINQLIMRRAEEYCAAQLPVYKLDAAGLRIMAQARHAMKQLVFCAYAFRMTGNEKYLLKAKEVFRTVCAFPDWNNQHFLDTAELTFGVAVAYDWLYYDLSLEERKLLHDRMVGYSLRAGLSHRFHQSTGNWNQVCNGGMMAAAIALYEKDRTVCAQTIEKGITSNRAMATAIYAPDGNYAEGYTYWDYGNFYQVAILKMLDTAFGSMAGLTEVEGLLKTGRFMQFMDGVAGPFSYSDGGSDTSTSNPAMWWYAACLQDASLLSNELRCLSDGIEPSDTRALPVMLSYAKDIAVNSSAVQPPMSSVWFGTGAAPVAIVHTGWRYDETDHYLGIKAGKASANHGHMDAGSFVYDALGQRWSADVANHDYASMEVAVEAAGASIWDVFLKTNLCHSCLSVMDYAEQMGRLHPSDFVLTGFASIVRVVDSASEKGAEIDMTPVYAGALASARRTILLKGDCDLIITDEVEALPSKDAPVQWRMLTPASASLSSTGLVLSQQGRTMYLRASATGGVTPSYMNLDPVRPPEWKQGNFDISLSAYRIVGYSATVPAGSRVVFTTILSPNKP